MYELYGTTQSYVVPWADAIYGVPELGHPGELHRDGHK